MGDFDAMDSPKLENLKQFMEAYYHSVKIRIVPRVSLSKVGELNEDEQLLVPDAMKFLRRRRAPRDVFAQIAITMVDITPGDGWNYVYGQASLSDGVGIFSFARYSANFWREERRTLNDKEQQSLLKKSCKTMAHEVGHIFGLRHCIYFHCIMNGNNGCEYTPLLACPVCLRKLISSISNNSGSGSGYGSDSGVDVRVRYEKLLAFYLEQGWEKEAGVIQQRLAGIDERVAEILKKGGEEQCKESKEREESTESKESGKSNVQVDKSRQRRVLGARVNLFETYHSSGKKTLNDGNNLKKVKVIAPRGVIVREKASKNSRKILTLRHGAELYVTDPPNLLRTSSGTVRVETSTGWTTGVTSRGMQMVDI